MAKIEQVWKTRGLAAILLWPLSQLFRLIAAVRRSLYGKGILKVWSAPLPVVVVGNLTVGGSGKTPLIIALAEKLRDAGIRPGIVCRGYRAKELSEPLIATVDSSTALAGDEPVLIAGRTACPVAVYPTRSLAIKKLLARHELDVVLLDDGLQHYSLDRNLEIVVVSEHVGFGNGFLLPAGPLREPLSRLREVDFVVRSRIYNKADNQTVSEAVSEAANSETSSVATESEKSDTPVLELPRFIADEKIHSYVLVLDELRRLDEEDSITVDSAPEAIANRLQDSVATNNAGKLEAPLIAMAGIANPSRFFKTISDLGLNVETVIQPDHHQFTAADFRTSPDAPVYILTEKDAVKCKELKIDKSRVWYAKMTAVPDQRLIDELIERITSLKMGYSDDSV